MRGLPLPLVCLTLAAALAHAADACTVTAGGATYELPAGVRTATRKTEQPPSTKHETISFDLCADLPRDEKLPEGDQCPSTTRACLVESFVKGDTSLITAVIPVGFSDPKNIEYASMQNSKGLEATFGGGAYMKNTQSFKISLLCAPEASDPKFGDYAHNVATVEWTTPAGCAKRNDRDGDNNPKPPPTGSSGGSLRMFFLLFVLAFVAYFAIGSYYNYNTYGASGWDVIPHKDFWRELPYLLRDLASHLCSAFQPRSRSGYVAV
ncbi:hypothetical protein AURDEDRAFT_111337 [Auricularia subglabra TFB-10046 SS5]|nr:hypothetical protein AURDEDRAFT_111337 [Auricularia subglabra TFB-10046 SS5]